MGMKGGKRVNRQTKASLSAGGVIGWGCSLRGGPRWLAALTPDTLVGSRRGDERTDAYGRSGEPRVHRVAEWGKVRLVCMTVVRTAIDGLAHPLAQTALVA